jgi:MYXO-CTERM domain-containing protein
MRTVLFSCALASVVSFAGSAFAATTYTYSPPDSGTNPRAWNDETQWSPNGVPGAGDTAIVTIGDTNPGLEADGVTIQSLTFTGTGNITGSGITLQSGGTFDWKSGDLTAPVMVPSGATLLIETAGAHELDGVTLTLQGTGSWTGGSLVGDAFAVLRNDGSLSIAAGSTSFGYAAGPNTADFFNTGTLTVTGSGTTNSSDGYWAFHNSGTMNFTGGGTLEFNGGGYSSLDDAGSITGTGTLLFDGAGQVSVTGTTTIGAGATLALGTGANVQSGTGAATLAGPGTLLWTGAYLAAGTQAVPWVWGSSLLVHLTGADPKQFGPGYVSSQASITWDQGNLQGTGNGVLVNAGTFTAQGDLSFSDANSFCTLVNRGRLTKSAGTGNLVVFRWAIDDYGTLDAASGTIELQTGPQQHHTLEDGASLNGSFLADTGAEVSLAGTALVASGATFELGSGGTLDGNGTVVGPGTVKLTGGVVNADTSDTITFAGGGQVVIPAGTHKTLIQDAAPGGVTFAGTTTWSGGPIELGGIVTNSGTWIANAPGAMTNASSDDTFQNTGTFTSNAGAGSVLNLDTATNAGTWVLQSGTTLFGFGGYTQTVGTTTLAGGTLAAHDDATPPGAYYIVDVQGGWLAGSGTVDAIVSNEGTVAPGSATSAGTLTVTQTYTQSSAGRLVVALGGTQPGTQFDLLAVNGDVALAGSMLVTYLGGYVPSVGSTYEVLTSASPSASIDGTFATVAPPPGVTISTTYGAEDVVLGVTAVDLPDAGAVDAGTREGAGPTAVSSSGGCSTAPGDRARFPIGLLALASAVGLAAVRRRRRCR